MPSRLPSVLAAIVLVAVLGLYMCCFEVRATEVAVKKTFGDADKDPITEPGLYWKWPWPVQEVVKYDTRIRVLEDTVEETPTADNNNITVTTFTFWKIVDPYKFMTAYPDLRAGEEALRTKVRAEKKAVVGLYRFNEFVSTEPQERKIRTIEDEMMSRVAEVARADFGVDIAYFGIKKLGLPTKVSQSVFAKMKAEQKKRADNYAAEGKARARDIVAEAEAKRDRIMAAAQREVVAIEGEGRTRVGQIYKQFEKHPELRIYLDKLAALLEILSTRTTVIFDTNVVPVDLFDETRRAQPGELKLELDDLGGAVPAAVGD